MITCLNRCSHKRQVEHRQGLDPTTAPQPASLCTTTQRGRKTKCGIVDFVDRNRFVVILTVLLVRFIDSAPIAWTLNLRGNDIPFNPVFYAYFLITLESAILFVEKAKLTEEVSQYLSELGVITEDYDNIWNFLRNKKWGEGKVNML